jgi:hypothetical protein
MKAKKQSIKSTKYKIFRNILSKEFAQFLMGYSLLKRKTLDTLQNHKYFFPFEDFLGTFDDGQVPNTYSHYGDLAMDTLLQVLRPVFEKKLNMKLTPNYSYQRIYKHGDVLEKHIDRNSCEISVTLNLGGDPWPIFLNKDKKAIKINLDSGDGLIYLGCELEHWREKFEGQYIVQTFLHYNNAKSKNPNLWDGRPHPGLPNKFCFKK